MTSTVAREEVSKDYVQEIMGRASLSPRAQAQTDNNLVDEVAKAQDAAELAKE